MAVSIPQRSDLNVHPDWSNKDDTQVSIPQRSDLNYEDSREIYTVSTFQSRNGLI